MAQAAAGTYLGDFRHLEPAPGLPEPLEVLLVREEWRGYIAMFLLALIGAVVLTLLIATVAGALSTDEVSALFEPLLTPLFTLVGSVVGFYFGRAAAQ